MTADHPLRRWLARVCSADTMARIVDPVLADIGWERRPRWLGYAALARALALHAIVSSPRALSAAWREDGFAIPRIALLGMLASLVFAIPIVAPTLRFAEAGAWVLLLPQAIVWTLPPVLLLAVPTALGGQTVSRRIARRTIALGIGLVAVTFVLILWIAPAAYDSYKQIEAVFIKPGNVAMVDAQFPNWSAAPAARLLEYQSHQQLAFGFAALPFAVLGLGLSTLPAVRHRPRLFGLLAAGAWMSAAFPLQLWTSAELLRASAVPPPMLAWTPALLVLATGCALLMRRSPSVGAAR